MNNRFSDSLRNTRRLTDVLLAERKKAIFAVCLILLMLFLWLRVFVKKRAPTSAVAALTSGSKLATDRPAQLLKISFIQLPEVKGRNDILTRDFFSIEDWAKSGRAADGRSLNSVEEVGGTGAYDNDENRQTHRKNILRVAEQLQLDAIALDKRPQAFINNKLVSVGAKLQVKDKTDLYEFDVVEISENEVVLTCDGLRIEIRILHKQDYD